MAANPRILIVEDNPDHLFITRQALERAGASYTIESKTNGEECLEALRREPADLVIIDYSLPDSDGLQLMREISMIPLDVPMIMITGQGDEEIAVGAMKLGAYDYLVKGKGFQQRLPMVVERVLSRHALRNELERSRESVLRRNRELSAVNALDEAIRRPRNPADVRKAALKSLLKEMEAECALFFLGTGDGKFRVTDVCCIQAYREGVFKGCTMAGDTPLFEGVNHARASTVRLSVFGKVETFPSELFEAALRYELLSWAVIPVALEEKSMGVILLGSSDPAFPMIEDPDVLTTLGNQVAIAHENARLYLEVSKAAEDLEHKVEERTRDLEDANKRLDRHVERLKFVQELSRRITQELDVEALCERVCDGARNLVGAEWAGIAKYDELKGGLFYKYSKQMPREFRERLYKPGQGATGIAWAERRPVFVESYSAYENRIADVEASVMALPLAFKGSFLGVLAIGSSRESRRLEQEDRDLATLLADQVAIALANARLFSELNEKAVELESANEKLRVVDRRKTEFLASMSHELMTPLNSIIGFTAALLRGLSGPLNEEQKRQLSIVKESASDLLELIKDLLDLSKIEVGRIDLKQETFDLPPLMDELKEIAERLVENAPIDVRVHVSENLPKIRTDRAKLRQILLNLVSNAVNYTDEGYIELSCDLTKSIKKSNGGHMQVQALRLSVIDTGRGILQDDLPYIFEEFRRGRNSDNTKPKPKGTGLGLAISKRLASALGARIEVATKPYQGSNFSLLLPESVICGE